MAEALTRLCDMAIREFGEYGGVNASIECSTTFTVLDPTTLQDIFKGQRGPQHGCYLYGRSFNPTVKSLGRHLAALEGTEAAYACSSGMAAISSALMALCNSGDHIVSSSAVYGGTFAFLKSFLPSKCNISTTFVPIANLEAVRAAITANTKVIYTESVSNPTLVVADIAALAEIAHARGITLVVDNTFTPLIISPAKHGADVVVHSMTKFMSGASDIVAGAVCGTAKFIDALMDLNTGPLMLLGPTMDPKVASELLLRIPHLGLRMQEHSRRALFMAEGLAKLGAKVTYPGLPEHPGYELMTSLANLGFGFGGLLGVEFASTAVAEAFMQRLQNKHGFGFMAVSLGYFDTLMSVSAASTSSELSPEEQALAGIPPAYVRMSIGITGTLEQRWAQLQDAFHFVQQFGANAKYRAVKVKHMADGHTEPLLSWPSEGSLISSEGAEGEGEGEASVVHVGRAVGYGFGIGTKRGLSLGVDSDEVSSGGTSSPVAGAEGGPLAKGVAADGTAQPPRKRMHVMRKTTLTGEPIEVIYEAVVPAVPGVAR